MHAAGLRLWACCWSHLLDTRLQSHQLMSLYGMAT